MLILDSSCFEYIYTLDGKGLIPFQNPLNILASTFFSNNRRSELVAERSVATNGCGVSAPQRSVRNIRGLE
jgi:hypothetical protein